VPQLVLCLRDYTRAAFAADVVAGVTVGLVALPLAMAFAIASGVPPQAGIYCAIVAGFTISALGGSRTQIGGPTGAFVVVVAGIVARHGMDGLFMCTAMAGVVLVVLGLTGLGTAVKYIPRPVVVGFTNGIAVLIISTQVKDLFGLAIPVQPGDFLGRSAEIAAHWGSLSWPATLMAASALVVMLLLRRFVPSVPGAVVALLLGTAAAWGFALPVDTIATRFGGIPSGWPPIAIPHFRADLILPLLSPTLTVAMLGAIESLLSAVVADRMTGTKHDPNVELFAQGIANMLSPLVGGLPATGAIARTGVPVDSVWIEVTAWRSARSSRTPAMMSSSMRSSKGFCSTGHDVRWTKLAASAEATSTRTRSPTSTPCWHCGSTVRNSNSITATPCGSSDRTVQGSCKPNGSPGSSCCDRTFAGRHNDTPAHRCVVLDRARPRWRDHGLRYPRRTRRAQFVPRRRHVGHRR